MNLNSGYFVGQLIKWFVIIIFLLPSLNLVGLDYIAGFLKDDVLGFLPKVVVAAFVLIIATIVADFLSKTVMAGSRAMNLKSTNMLGSLVKYTVWVFAFIIALGQLGVAEGYMNTLFAGIVGMLALAGALAFGLGAKDAAGRLISKLGKKCRIKNIKKVKKERIQKFSGGQNEVSARRRKLLYSLFLLDIFFGFAILF